MEEHHSMTVKLSDLEPRWIHPNVLAFRCPCCRKLWLTIKNVVMPEMEQHRLFKEAFGEWWNLDVVGSRPGFAWAISGDLNNLTFMPSVDASASGHWHGYITNGVAE
jgi:hypothetical protein